MLTVFLRFCQHNRENARKKQRLQQRPLLWKLIKKGIPQIVFSKFNAMREKCQKTSSKNIRTEAINYKKKFSIDQLSYRSENLDAAMNLMAICADDGNLFKALENTLELK